MKSRVHFVSLIMTFPHDQLFFLLGCDKLPEGSGKRAVNSISSGAQFVGGLMPG